MKEVLIMSVNKRKNEVLSGITSFTKRTYAKSELLPELFQLQSELVDLTFNGEHAENAQLKIWDVYNHLSALNAERGNVVDGDLMHRLWTGCKAINEAIRGEISGNKGEHMALRSLDTVRSYHTIIRNVELSSGEHRTELDIVVFTEKAVFIVEVKNPTRNVFIDVKGNYCRVNNGHVSYDKNIGEKMNDKSYLLRCALEKAGVENPNIVSLVVFTNNNINVTNEFPYIRHCFLSSLPHLIDCYEGNAIYTEEQIAQMMQATKDAQCSEAYPLEMDIAQFKEDFATVMAILESAGDAEEKVLPEEPVKAQVASVAVIPTWVKGVAAALAFIPVVGLASVTAVTLSKLTRK